MKRIYLSLLCALLSGCAVGPDFDKPVPELPKSWNGQLPKGVAQGASVDAQWWRQFNDPQLNKLVDRAAARNLDIRVASIRLEQSRMQRQVSGAQQFPGVGIDAGYQRARNSQDGLIDSSGHSGQKPYELWSGALDASWEIDLWGHVRRIVEAADAQTAVTQAQLDGAMLSVTAEAAADYIKLRGVQAQIAVARQNLDIAQQSLKLTQNRFQNGVTTHLDTANAAAQVATIQATLPMLNAEQQRLINALSFLVDETPGALRHELEQARPIPKARDDISLGLPSELARRRPDIQASEAELHKATAEIGVAKADFYPRVSLGGSFGVQAQAGSDVGDWRSRQWSFGPSLYLPIFQGGRLTGTLELRKRQQQEAALNFHRVVLNAWHEVDNAVTDYNAEREHHQALSEAVEQNEIALQTARSRYQEGALDYLNVLSVQRSLLATQLELVNSTTGVSLNRIYLYRALGGGWSKASR
ncbi:hypothetical protein TUM12370_10600 [Salmonella enterica subsp. enterica serovar Choleraesuis]|nr:hypothetical protein TUM12370_10600 [Salmonella enterica subsp. enterica serovar Choleraesuis]